MNTYERLQSGVGLDSIGVELDLPRRVVVESDDDYRARLAVAAQLPELERLRAALEQIRVAHKFNVSTMTPNEVHKVCFNALRPDKVKP